MKIRALDWVDFSFYFSKKIIISCDLLLKLPYRGSFSEEVHIRGGTEINSKIIFLISQGKHMLLPRLRT